MSTDLNSDIEAVLDSLRAQNPDAAYRLESLAEAVQPDGDPSGWAGVDMFAAIDPLGTARRVREAPLTDSGLAKLERLRNFLVFLPVTLTWFGLTYAAAGYSAAIQAAPDLITQPFLLLWEHGFNGLVAAPWSLLSFLTFSHVAVGDGIVLVVVLLLTWQIHSNIDVQQAERERRAQAIERQLVQLAWSASLFLARRTSPRANDDRSRQVLEALLDELRAERERGKQLAGQREREAADLRTFGSEFRVGAQDLRRMSGEVGTTFEAMLNVVTQLDNRLAGLTDEQAEIRSDLATLSASLTEYQNAQREAADEANKASADLVRVSAGISDAALQSAQTVSRAGDSFLQVANGLQVASTTQAQLAQTLAAGVQATASAAAELRSAVGAVTTVSAALGAVAPDLASAAADQVVASQAVNASLGEFVAQNAVASGSMLTAVAGLTAEARRLRETVQMVSDRTLAGSNVRPGRWGRLRVRLPWFSRGAGELPDPSGESN